MTEYLSLPMTEKYIPQEYEPWVNLAEAVLDRAAKDYATALSGKRPPWSDESAPPIWYVRRIEEWLREDAGEILMGLDPEKIIKTIGGEA